MEKDLSLILLLIAGIILLFLFIYSFRTRVDKFKPEASDFGKADNFADDEDDILTMRSDEYLKVKESPKANSKKENFAAKFSFSSKEKTPDTFKSTHSITTAYRNQDDFEEEGVISLKPTAQKFEPSNKSVLIQPRQPAGNHAAPVAAPIITVPAVQVTANPISIKEQLDNFKPQSMLMLHILPQAGEKFIGFDLLQALLVANLRFGNMSIFHRHTLPMGKGNILFSVAQASEPGTFNMNTIGSCQCSGLVMFMQLTGPEHNLELLDQFIQTAQQLADNLGGIVVSKKRDNPVTHEIKKQFIASVQYHLENLSAQV